MVLQAVPIHRGGQVGGRVVDRRAVDVRRVQPGEAGLAERGEVGVVRQQPVDLDGERGAHRVRRVGIRLDEPRVLRRGLEHDRRTRAAARLQVDRDAAVAGQVVLLDERLGAAETGLLGVGQHQDHVVEQLTAFGQRAGRLQDGGDAGRVVVAAGAGLRRVVVRDQEDPLGGGLARDHRHHVADPGQAGAAGAGRQLAALDRDGVLHLRGQAQPGQGLHQVVTDPIVGRAAGRMRRRRDRLHGLEGPLGAELAGRRGGRGRGRRQDKPDRGEAREGEHSEDGQGGEAAPSRPDEGGVTHG